MLLTYSMVLGTVYGRAEPLDAVSGEPTAARRQFIGPEVAEHSNAVFSRAGTAVFLRGLLVEMFFRGGKMIPTRCRNWHVCLNRCSHCFGFGRSPRPRACPNPNRSRPRSLWQGRGPLLSCSGFAIRQVGRNMRPNLAADQGSRTARLARI